ncbi:unnamed protein product [Chironomus riparius]|uniref:Fatty acyl-CoA reductase n=1 Tax=Chironomus riparius TaxID=315576 RepID=A0A9P0NEC1_9DIPT|nr:unnamed protein product [Chironomus riparius]
MVLQDINRPSISDFYNGRSVFVTGGTGFLGKLVVEKLLRSCPGIENIYFLIRSRHNKNIKDRHLKVVNSPAFDLIREKNPEALKKIVLIEGDVSCLELGISKAEQEVLFEKVSVVIHTAASVALNDSLKKAVLTNLRSLRELIKLAHQMKNLKSMIHTSTAYCNLILPEIKEQIHPIDIDPHAVIHLCENFPDEVLKEFTTTLLKNHQNTYVFAKALAEILITKDAKDLPIAIVRPSINAVARGMFCSGYFAKDALCDVVPADMVVNTIIAASWTVTREKTTFCDDSPIKVYNSVSGDAHPITFESFAELSVNIGKTYPSAKVVWYPEMRCYESKWAYEVDQFFTHLIPAYLTDFYQKLSGGKTLAVKFYTTHKKIFDAANFVATLPFKFKSDKCEELLNSMEDSPNEEFYFDLRSMDWKSYHHDFYFGIRKFILKEHNLDSVKGKKKLVKLRSMKYLLGLLLIAFVVLTVLKLNEFLFKL